LDRYIAVVVIVFEPNTENRLDCLEDSSPTLQDVDEWTAVLCGGTSGTTLPKACTCPDDGLLFLLGNTNIVSHQQKKRRLFFIMDCFIVEKGEKRYCFLLFEYKKKFIE
jgi:hypothetical protein